MSIKGPLKQDTMSMTFKHRFFHWDILLHSILFGYIVPLKLQNEC